MPQSERRPQEFAPFALRWRVRAIRRLLHDARAGLRFARRRPASRFTSRVAAYELPMRCYPGQEARFGAKRRNLALSLAAIDGVVVRRGEVLSFWRCVGRPTRSSGYLQAAALKRGLLVEDVGGAVCLSSTLIYNVGLLCGFTVIERHAHSVDSYGIDRYFQLGRDAAVEYAYRDVRLRNDFDAPILIRARLEERSVCAEAWTDAPSVADVELLVSGPVADDRGGFRVRTQRTMRHRGHRTTEDLGWSTYRRGTGGPDG